MKRLMLGWTIATTLPRGHGDCGEAGNQVGPFDDMKREHAKEYLEHEGEPHALGSDGEEGGDRSGGALINVGGPEVKGDDGEFETDARHEQGRGEPEEWGGDGEGVADCIEICLAGDSVENGEAVIG